MMVCCCPCTVSPFSSSLSTTTSHRSSVNIHIIRLNTPTTHLSTYTPSDYQLPSLLCQHTHHQTTNFQHTSVNTHIIRLPTPIAHLSTHTSSDYQLPAHICQHTHHQTTNFQHTSVNTHIIRLPTPIAHLSTDTSDYKTLTETFMLTTLVWKQPTWCVSDADNFKLTFLHTADSFGVEATYLVCERCRQLQTDLSA